MIDLPKTIEDVEMLVRDRVPEDIHLDYKRSAAIADDKRGEIAKDVSAFLNSDGGVLIYGVEEDQAQHVPARIDDGVDHTQYSREWLEHVIGSNIQPRIDGLEIAPIPVSPGRSFTPFGFLEARAAWRTRTQSTSGTTSASTSSRSQWNTTKSRTSAIAGFSFLVG